MKLYEIAARAIKILQEAGPEGIHSTELIKRLGIPRRRIYDIIAVFSAANLIRIVREKGGSKLYWIEALPEPSKKMAQLEDMVRALKKENEELKAKYEALLQKAETREVAGEKQVIQEMQVDKIKLPVKKVEIRAEVPHRITRVYSTGIGAIVESDGEGLIIIPAIKKTEAVQKSS
ncbi:MAG: hypothetical protein ACP6IS_03970 [Candidatus Asgardarchaeia archaeon]